MYCFVFINRCNRPLVNHCLPLSIQLFQLFFNYFSIIIELYILLHSITEIAMKWTCQYYIILLSFLLQIMFLISLWSGCLLSAFYLVSVLYIELSEKQPSAITICGLTCELGRERLEARCSTAKIGHFARILCRYSKW